MDFAIPADHCVKLKESEKRDKYLNVARELKKLWNMRVGIGALGKENELRLSKQQNC